MDRDAASNDVPRRRRAFTLASFGRTRTRRSFNFEEEELRKLHNPKNIQGFVLAGGVRGLVEGLKSDRENGIGLIPDRTDAQGPFLRSKTAPPSSASPAARDDAQAPPNVLSRQNTGATYSSLISERRDRFGANSLPARKAPNFFQLLWQAYRDRVLFLLTAAAVVSLGIGLYQTFTSTHDVSNPPIEWVNAAAILIAISVIVLVSCVNDWGKWRQFRVLNRKQLERKTRVTRSGSSKLIPRDEIVVGDMVQLESGDVVPADGILISGYDIGCDEANATGESGLIRKTPGDEVYEAHRNRPEAAEVEPGLDPFMLSGTRVLEGVGTFLVTCTGSKSTYGKLLGSQKYEEDPTPLQRRLGVLASYMVYVGAVVSGLLFLALLIVFCANLSHDDRSPTEKGQAFIDIVIISLSVLVIAMPEGVPLAATLSLAYGTTRMLKDDILVRQLKGCETMGNATSISSDIAGTLTENKMAVLSAIIGRNVQYHDKSIFTKPKPGNGEETNENETCYDVSELVSHIAADVKQLLQQSISLNTTAFEDDEDDGSFVGPHLETALLRFARQHLGMGPLREEKDEVKVVQVIPFNAARQCTAIVIELPTRIPSFRVLVKGASERLLSNCTRIFEDTASNATTRAMSAEDRKAIQNAIDVFGSKSLQTVSLAYRDLPSFKSSMEPQTTLEYVLQSMTFLSVFGMLDTLRPGLPDLVQQCQNAGVTVRVVTGDSLLTATTIAGHCGIFTADTDDLAMEGAEFRELDEARMKEVCPRLKILARCSPQDKERLVKELRSRKEIVAVTGYSTSDVPAMVAADGSFSMGSINGTEVARQASSIILMKGDFTSIVKCIMWGRTVGSSVKKFLQFQISVTITVAFIAFVSALSNSDGASVLSPVQLMWVNLFQDTGALALATDRPQPRDLQRQPEPRDAPLITVTMWKTIVGMSIYQLGVTYILYFAGPSIFPSDRDVEVQQLNTLVFNTYVWMQIFTIFNCRQYDNTLNVFEGMIANRLFLAFVTTMIGIQVLIIFVGGEAIPTVPLTGVQWATSLVLGLLVLPVGVLLRCIPDGPIVAAVQAIRGRLRRKREEGG